ncbi:hypothetical protein Daus18300_002892 [Diaporthe australafricana]|uniref:Uncharacterized protein n=1 Tax=Diaporthe australafricana TaxID=127596 RepID=A0ABR3XJX5_9PEZI
MNHIAAPTPTQTPATATPIPVPICAPVDSPALEAEEVSAAGELVDVAKARLSSPVAPSDTVAAGPSDCVAVDSAEDVVVDAAEESAVDASEEVSVDVSADEVVVEVAEEVVVDDGVAAVEELSPTVVAARSDASKDHWSEFAPLPTAALELGFRSNQHGVSEPDQESLMRAVLL